MTEYFPHFIYPNNAVSNGFDSSSRQLLLKQFNVDETQLMDTEAKKLRGRMVKILESHESMDKVRVHMDKSVEKILEYKRQIKLEESILQEKAIEYRNLQQQYVNLIQHFNIMDGQINRQCDEIATKMWQQSDARVQLDVYRQKIILLEKIASAKTLNDKIPPREGCVILSKKDAKKRLRSIINDAYMKKMPYSGVLPESVQQPTIIIPQPSIPTISAPVLMSVQPSTIVHNQVQMTVPTPAVSTAISFIPQSQPPQSIPSFMQQFSISPVHGEPIDASKVEIHKSILSGSTDSQRKPSSIEFVNQMYGNLTFSTQTELGIDSCLPSIKLVDEQTFLSLASLTNGNNCPEIEISFQPIYTKYSTAELIQHNIMPHSLSLLDEIQHQDRTVFMLNEDFRTSEKLVYVNTNAGIAEHSQKHLINYCFLEAILKLIQTSAAITKLFSENSLYPISEFTEILGTVYWFQKKDVELGFESQLSVNVLAIYPNMRSIMALLNLYNIVDGKMDGTITSTDFDELAHKMKEVPAICIGVHDFLTKYQHIFMDNYDKVSETIYLINRDYWLVFAGFNSLEYYSYYQTIYLDYLHKGASSLWRSDLQKVPFFNTREIPYAPLCNRKTSLIKKATPTMRTLPTSLTTTNGSAIVKKKPRGRPKKNTAQQNELMSFGLMPAPPPQTSAEIEINKQVKSVKEFLDNLTKHLQEIALIQHSYLEMKIPRTNSIHAPVPLSVPPYVFLNNEARFLVRQQFAFGCLDLPNGYVPKLSQVYCTDLTNEKVQDTLLEINGCGSSFVSRLEKNGTVTVDDLMPMYCNDCGLKIRIQTKKETHTKMQHYTHCFGYIPCHCRELDRCVRCFILRWLWDYNVSLSESGGKSSFKGAIDHLVVCVKCQVRWKIQELCVVSFDDLCQRSGIVEIHSDPKVKGRRTLNGSIPKATSQEDSDEM